MNGIKGVTRRGKKEWTHRTNVEEVVIVYSSIQGFI
jgi:hypothetical protein